MMEEMRKSWLKILLAISLMSGLCACVNENADDWSWEDARVSLVLSPGTVGVSTKATEYGSDVWNENVISNFRLYFYNSESSGDDVAAVYVWPESGWASANNTGAVTSGTNGLTEDPATGKVSVNFTVSRSLVGKLFTSLKSCRVYAVANVDGVGVIPYAYPTVNQIKSVAVTAEFGPTLTEDPYAKAQDSFVMSGEGTLARYDDSRTISGDDIKLYRSAAKATFYVSKVDNEDVEDKNWAPDTENMHVAFIGGFNKGYIDGLMPPDERASDSYKYSGKLRKLTAYSEGGISQGWTHEMPFWSYPCDWSSADGDTAPYFLLSVPWRHSNSEGTGYDRYFTCYYAVPFNSIDKKLQSNAWYKVKLSVSILGSGDPDNPTVITPSYMILPWGNEDVKTNADLLRYRYLMVDQNEYVMNNVSTLSVPFYSSHSVTIESAVLTYTVLAPSGTTTVYTPSSWGRWTTTSLPVYEPEQSSVAQSAVYNSSNVYDASKYVHIAKSVQSNNDTLVFYHPLNNDYNSSLDVSEYVLTVVVSHSDNPSYKETIVVRQRPALYVVASLNSDCNSNYINYGTSGYYISGRNYTCPNYNNYGYVYVNAASRGDSGYWYSVTCSNAGNKDPYMYVVNVSSLPKNTPFIIGDPRTENVDNLSYSFSSAAWMYGSNHRLSYYYPTDQTASSNHMIAPSFRIASSYGVVSPISYSEAKYRCASYQEDGYPAGRWRVPTRAEIWYMAFLAENKRIPRLLSEDTYYWGGDGYGYYPSTDYLNPTRTNSTSENIYVRCVYDEWYWNDKCDKSTFTWGDRQR